MEVMYRELARELEERGHTVIKVYEGDTFGRRKSGEWGLPLASVRTRHRIPTLSSIRQMMTSYRNARKCLRRERPDVVYIQFITFTALYFLLLRYVYKYRLVVSARGSDLLRPNAISLKSLPLILKRADATIVISDALKKRAISLGANPINVYKIYNGLDVEWWRSRPDDCQENMSHRIVFVGRLEKVKGPDILLKSFGIVQARNEDIYLDVIGDGSMKGALQDLAKELGIFHRVTFHGAQNRQYVRTVLHRASAFVMPSRSEGLGLAILEAMAVGTPLIGTRVGGIPEVIDDTFGILVEPEKPEELAEAIRSVLADPSRASMLRQGARDRSLNFTKAACFDRYEQVLKATLG